MAFHAVFDNYFEYRPHMYYKIIVKLIIGKIDTSIDFKVGVKQGDIMSPVLFMFLMIEFSETP